MKTDIAELKVCSGGAFKEQTDSCHRALERLRNWKFQLPLKVDSKAGVLGGGTGKRMEILFKDQLDLSHHSPDPYNQVTATP